MNLWRIFGRSGISAACMGAAAWAVYRLLHGMTGHTTIPFLAAVAVGVIVYAVMIVAIRAITLEDMKLIPKGEKVAKLLHIR